MALSDCIKCWSTPCECGYEYKDWSENRLRELIEVLQNVLDQKEKENNLKK